MELGKMAERVKSELAKLTNMEVSGVIGVTKSDEEGSVVTIEMIEKKSIPDGMDVLGTYEVKVNNNGEIVDFARTRLRKRIDTQEG